MSTLGDIMGTLEDVQYIRGHHEYIRGCSVHQGDVMMHVRGYHEYIRGCSVHQDFQYKLHFGPPHDDDDAISPRY